MADQASTASNYPDYYHEVVKFRKHGFQVDPKVEICLRFVPSKDELNAVYNTPLTNLLSKKQLPFAVKVKQNFNVVGKNQDGINLKAGGMLMLHFIVRPERIFAADSKREDVVLPMHAEQLYEVLPMDSAYDDKVFYGTAEVIMSKPLPKRLRIIDAIYSDSPAEAQEKGEIIEVSHVEKQGNVKVLVGRSTLTKQSFAFPEHMRESTYSAMISEEHLTLSTIVKKFKLPLVSRLQSKYGIETFKTIVSYREGGFIGIKPALTSVFAKYREQSPQNIRLYTHHKMNVLKETVPKLYMNSNNENLQRRLKARVRKVGEKKSAFILNEVRKEAQVICTDPQKNHVFSMPLTCPVHLDYIDNQGVEAIVKATVPQLYPLLNWTWNLMEIGRAPLPPQQRQTPQPLLGVLCHWLNSKDGLELVSMISDSSSETKNAKILALERKIRELERKLPQQPRPSVPPRSPISTNNNKATDFPRPLGRKPSDRNSMLYEQVLPTPAPRPSPLLNVELEKKKKETENLRKEKQELVTSLTKHQVENRAQQAKISELQREIVRLKKENSVVPINDPATSYTQYEVPSQKKFSSESVEGILNFLDRIGLSAYSKKFQEESVDGALLCDLVTDGEDIFLTELKMGRLHARKLIVEIKKRL